MKNQGFRDILQHLVEKYETTDMNSIYDSILDSIYGSTYEGETIKGPWTLKGKGKEELEYLTTLKSKPKYELGLTIDDLINLI